jgi:predicted DNA-binding protein
MSDGPVIALSTKLPVAMRDKLTALARRCNLTPSALLRQLVESYLAGSIDDETGDVEHAVRAEFIEAGVQQGPHHAVAMNLARRMDRDATNRAARARELKQFLNELQPPRLYDNPPDSTKYVHEDCSELSDTRSADTGSCSRSRYQV